MDELVAYYDRKKVIKGFLSSKVTLLALLLLVYVWVLGEPQFPYDRHYGFLFSIGPLMAVGVLILMLQGLFDRNVWLRINKEGIYYKSFSSEIIPWSNIGDIKFNKFKVYEISLLSSIQVDTRQENTLRISSDLYNISNEQIEAMLNKYGKTVFKL